MFEHGIHADELFSALQHLRHAKHEVVLFHVTDKEREMEFAFDNRPYRFCGPGNRGNRSSFDRMMSSNSMLSGFPPSAANWKCVVYNTELILLRLMPPVISGRFCYPTWSSG